jgi:hypothetical protein
MSSVQNDSPKKGDRITFFIRAVVDYGEDHGGSHNEVWAEAEIRNSGWNAGGFLLSEDSALPAAGELVILECTGEPPPRWNIARTDHVTWKVVE